MSSAHVSLTIVLPHTPQFSNLITRPTNNRYILTSSAIDVHKFLQEIYRLFCGSPIPAISIFIYTYYLFQI